jgi:hypothetical protein
MHGGCEIISCAAVCEVSTNSNSECMTLKEQTLLMCRTLKYAHCVCRASSVMARVEDEVLHKDARFILHIGDVSYADGKGHVWEQFMEGICRFADSVPYMVAVGNHDYDYKGSAKNDPSGLQRLKPKWGQFTPDSLGECGVALAKRFSMPYSRRDPASALPSLQFATLLLCRDPLWIP